MPQQSTYIVPPTYEAAIYGFECVEVGVRKAHLLKNGKRALSAFYKQENLSTLKRFSDWVTFITSAQSAK